MESIISYTSGDFPWLEMMLVWAEVDKNEQLNRSAFRLLDVRVRNTGKGVISQPLYSENLEIKVGSQTVVSIPAGEMYLTSGVGTEFRSMMGYSLESNPAQTNPLTHGADGSLTANITVNGGFMEEIYLSPTTSQTRHYRWNGSGRMVIEAVTDKGDGETAPVKWITARGAPVFLAALGTAVKGMAFYTRNHGSLRGTELLVEAVSGDLLRISAKAPAVPDISEVTEVRLLDSGNGVIGIKQEQGLTLKPGREVYYYMQFGLTGM